jgi:two-component system, LytTR family, response regulator
MGKIPFINSPLERNRTITLKIKNEYQVILMEEIVYCLAEGSYTTIKLFDGSQIVVSKSLCSVGKSLDCNYFIRCHHGCIVNIKNVTKFNIKTKILTVLDYNIKVSRRKYSLLVKKLNSLNDLF